MDGRSGLRLRARLALHCLLVETDRELILVDTGLGLRDVARPRTRLHWFFRFLNRPAFREEMTAVRQIEKLGFDARDVRHIVLTHLDFDHAGGLDDFPDATVHLLHDEREVATAQRTWLDRARYRPQQWSTIERWKTYPAVGESWMGFDAVRNLDGVPPEILLVPLPGHTIGHTGVAVIDKNRWLLDASDAYFYRGEMDLANPRCTPGLRFYQWMMEQERGARLDNQERLRELKRDRDDVRIFCGHDPVEFELLAGRALDVPVTGPMQTREARRVGVPDGEQVHATLEPQVF